MAAAEITWLGHATVLIEMDGLRILTDPVLRHRIGPTTLTFAVFARSIAAGRSSRRIPAASG
jgi:L-ascorbate metabolism protein UlaG (beta-lactamase superfamily)